MYVIFGTSKKGLGKFLPSKKRYTLIEADNQLKLFTKTLSVRKKPNYVIIEIYDDEEMIFRSDFVAGTDESNNLRLLLLNLLKTEFPDVDEEEKSELLQRINHAYLAETNPINDYERKAEEEPAPQIITIVEKTPTEAEAPKESVLPVEEGKKPSLDETKIVHETKKKQISKKPAFDFAGFFVKKKRLLVLILALLILSGAGITLFVTGSNGSNQQESYSELVKEGKYSQALNEYPDEESKLIEQLYSKKKSKTLKSLADDHHSKMARFYWAFLNKKWNQVTEIKGINQDTTVQAMRGYAYLAQGKLEEAELINKVLKNDTLNDQIYQARKDRAYQNLRDQDISAAELINKEINDPELEEDIKVAKSIVNLLKKYQADKSNSKLSETDRKEAEKNFELWTSNLEQLGGKSNDGR